MAVTARFLHVADVHLGFDRYDSPERSRDFFLAFRDVLQKHAINRQVDFVLIAGDLFEHRQILPHVLNQAESALGSLKAAGIPVLAIEGNHDNRPFGVKTSWLRYLADHDFLILLEPTETESGGMLEAWAPQTKRGGYLDLECGVRVIGSQWYGSSASRAIQDLAPVIQELPNSPPFQILLFHHGLEGQIARYQGALRYSELLPLQEAGVDYLALGHIHKSYEKEGWIFNPGSIEANSIEESMFDRGAFYVEVDDSQIKAQLVTDYQQRPCYRLKLEAKGRETCAEVEQRILDLVNDHSWDPAEAPIVELKLTGQVGFSRQELDSRAIQQQCQALTGALIFLFRFEAVPLEYDLAPQATENDERLAVEEQVYTDILAGHAHYRKRSPEFAKTLLGLKEMVLDEMADPEVYRYLHQTYFGLAEEE